MPRTKLDAIADPGKILRGTVKKYSSISGKTIKDCSESTGISRTVLYSRLHDPNKMTVDELRRIRRYFSIPGEEIMSVLQEML